MAVNGQQSGTDTLQMDTVAVRAGRAPGKDAARPVTRIDAMQLPALPVHSPDDFLDYLPWIDLRSRGNLGVQGDLSIRGASYEQTLILLDGVPLADPQTGHHNLNLPIPMEMISGMEVMASGASRIFGPKAMAGSVNFTTRLPLESRIWASLSGGEYGLFRLAGGFSYRRKSWGLGLSAQTMGSNGYVQNTDFSNQSLFFQAYRSLKHGKVWLNALGGKKRFGAQNFYSATFPWQQEYTSTAIVSLNWEFSRGNWDFYGNAHWRYNQDRFELYREGADWYTRQGNRYVRGTDTTPAWYSGHNYHRSSTGGLMLNATRKWGIHRVSLGAEARNEQVMSNVLGEPMSNPVQVSFGPEGAMFTKSADRQNISVFVEDQLQWKKWLIAGGLLINDNSLFGRGLYPGLEAAYKLTGTWKLFANVNRANRFPTYTDLYYNRGGATGSKDLKPEEAISSEAGAEWRSKRHFLRMTSFVRDGRQMIDWVRLSGSSNTVATNLTRVTYFGADAWWIHKPAGKLGRYLSRVGLGAFYMDADNKSDGFESNYALDFVNVKLSGSADIRITDQVNISLVVIRQQRRGGYIAPGKSTETAFEPFFQADLRCSWVKNGWTIFAEGRNLLNAAVMDLGNVQLPGRWLSAGLRFEWMKKP